MTLNGYIAYLNFHVADNGACILDITGLSHSKQLEGLRPYQKRQLIEECKKRDEIIYDHIWIITKDYKLQLLRREYAKDEQGQPKTTVVFSQEYSSHDKAYSAYYANYCNGGIICNV
jgi:hypothetical protein